MELLRYEKLRHMVLADDAEGLRVASVHWASMYKELEQRVNTIEIAIHRLDKVWRGAGGRTALLKYRHALEVMQSAMWTAKSNAENIGNAYDALVKAQKDMRALDRSPNKATETPNPQPGGTEMYAWDLDSRQPAASGIAKNLSYSYAWAGAGYTPLLFDPQTSVHDKHPGTDSSGSPDGTPPGAAQSGSGRSGGSRDGSGRQPGPSAPAAGPGGIRGSGPALGGSRSPAGGARTPTAVPQPSSAVGEAPSTSSEIGVPGGVSGGTGSAGASRSRLGSPGTRGGVGGGTVRFGGGDPGGKTLGGGMRPATGLSAEPSTLGGAGGNGQPPLGGGVPGGGSGTGHGGGRGKRKPRYERGEPEMFIDGRQKNAAGGTIRQPGAAKSFDVMPGVLGSQKHKPVEAHNPSNWELPATTPAPEGFPERVEDSKFTRSDGVQFEVRRRKGGA
jgi:hypothetical protein